MSQPVAGSSARASKKPVGPSAPPLSVDCAVIRLIDASLNRAAEGARVVEDYARFVLDDGHLSSVAKGIRHGIAEQGNFVPMRRRLACRDTPGDVGTQITTASEASRSSAHDVCLASLHRVQEALRSLEEYSKTVDPAVGAAFERLRYDAYTLGAAIGATVTGEAKLRGARLYVLLDGQGSSEGFESLVQQLCDGGAGVIQLRDKRLDDRTLTDRARRLVRIARNRGVLAIMNDRPDIARIADADGVHVGQTELSVADARKIVGPDRIVGLSTHAIDQARLAVLAGADYLGVGPTFPSTTKSFDSFPGLAYVAEVAAEIRLPAFAIGGITPQNAAEVFAAGASRIAVSSAITTADDPSGACRRLLELLPEVDQEESRD